MERFKASGWVTDTCDGHDAADIFRALAAAQESDAPVMIACRTIIGFGMPGREGTQKAHSDAPGAEIVAGTRKELGWAMRPSWCLTICSTSGAPSASRAPANTPTGTRARTPATGPGIRRHHQ